MKIKFLQKLMNKIVQNIRYFLLIIILIIFFLFSINNYIINFSKNNIIKIKNINNIKVGLVLGAGIKNNKEPTDILKDRLITTIQAYKNKKINKIIVSGDNSKIYHNEPDVMKKFLIQHGINKNDIFPDYAGFNTYDSIYRLKKIFGVKKVIIFTQKYHLYRSIYIAKKLGINAFGIPTNLHKYKAEIKFKLRELLARLKAFIEVEFIKPKPKFLGEKIKIN